MTDIQTQTKTVQTVELTLRGPDGQIKRQDTITMEAIHGNTD